MPENPPPLRLGMFVMPVHDPKKPLAQCSDEDVELAIKCEELGYSDFWVGEHHSSTIENIVMPEIFLAKVAGLTKSMRLGPAPVCLQYHHPAHVANRLAYFDHLTHGRLNVCFGPGAIPTDIELYGIDPQETAARVSEAIDIILTVWHSDPPYEYHGDFWDWQLRDSVDLEMGLGPLRKPLQQPTPPIHVPIISRRSPGLAKAAARGFRPISHHMIHPDVLADQWQNYTEGAEAAGLSADPCIWSVSRNIFVAETTEEARRLARGNSMGRCIEYIVELTRRGPGVKMWKRNEQMHDEEVNLDYFMDQIIIAGDPAEVTRQLVDLREQIGPFGTLVQVAHDWDNREVWLKNLELFANEVLPAFNRKIGAEVGE